MTIPEISNSDTYRGALTPINDRSASAAEPAKLEVVAHNLGRMTAEQIYNQFAFATGPYASRGQDYNKSAQEASIDKAYGLSKDAIGFARKLKDDAIAQNAVFAAKKLGEAVAAAAGLASGIGGLFKR